MYVSSTVDVKQGLNSETLQGNSGVPKLLFISPTFPYPFDQGWHPRIYNFLQACSDRFEVTLVAPPAPDQEARTKVAGICRILLEVDPTIERASVLERLTMSFYCGEKVGPGRARNYANFKRVVSTLNLDDYALIWVTRRYNMQFVRGYTRNVILDLDDIDYVRRFREIRKRSSLARRLIGYPQVASLFYWEVLRTKRLRNVIVCSEDDRSRLNRLGLRNAKAVPNGTFFTPSARSTFPNGNRAVFLGNVKTHVPNLDAVRYFDREILPLIASRLPGFTLDVIGVKPDNTEGFSDAIRFRGFVPDLEAALQDYRVMAVPLRFGAGTKLKIIDGLASGIAVVTTSIGAEGLHIVPDRHAVIADTAGSFADAVVRLLADEDHARRLSREGSSLMAQHFSWHRIRQDLSTWLSTLAV